MSVVVFYITGHGFGHASREVEVINVLGGLGHQILIRSAVNAGLLARTVRVPYELLPGPCDTGVVQISSIENDDEATVEAALRYYARLPEHIETEIAALGRYRVRAIVGDIPPLAFEVAARLCVPSIALANFTWDWIYETHPGFLPAGAQVLATIRAAYAKAALALQLPFSAGFDVFARVQPIPLIARQPTESREAMRRRLDWPREGRVAVASFGGYGLPSMDLGRLDCADEWTIVTTDRVSPDRTALPRHVRYLSETELSAGGLRYENVIAAADAVVTKPGYGILSECIATGTPMLYTSRGAFREYDLLVAAMPRVVRCRFIPPRDLIAGRWGEALNALVAEPPPPVTMPTDGARVAAGLVASCSTV